MRLTVRYVARNGMILAALLLFAGPVRAGTAFVQSKHAQKDNSVGSTSIAATFTTNVTAGNLIAVWVAWGDLTQTASVADNLGNAYTAVDTDTGTQTKTWYAKNILGGACTVTVTFSASITAFQSLVIHEISGADTSAPLDGHSFQKQTGVTAISSGSATTTANGDYIFGAAVQTDSTAQTISPGAGFTGRETNHDGAFLDIDSEDQIQPSAASIDAKFTGSVAMNTSCSMMAFKPASGAAAPAGINKKKKLDPVPNGSARLIGQVPFALTAVHCLEREEAVLGSASLRRDNRFGLTVGYVAWNGLEKQSGFTP